MQQPVYSICILLRQTLSSGQKPVWSDMTIPGQIALPAIFYFGQVFVFHKLINKKVLQWFLLIMCKEHSLGISKNLLSRNHPALCGCLRREGRQMPNTYLILWLEVNVQNHITNFWTTTFSTCGSAYLDFSRTVTSKTII